MPPIPYKTPAWVDPNNASVTDSWFTWAARQVGRLVGADDPASSVMGLAGAMEVPAAKAAGKVIKAFHGSPHDFDQFSLQHIGTGEGAQAYGHGLYFAENENVAREYRDTLSYLKDDESRQILDVLPKTFQGPDNVRGIVANIRKAISDGDIKKPSEFAQQYDVGPQLQDAYRKAGEILDNKGRMYEVNIHASPDELLDWDKPLSQQSETVRANIEKIRRANKKAFGLNYTVTPTERLQLGEWSEQQFGPQYTARVKAGKKDIAVFQGSSPEDVAAKLEQWKQSQAAEFHGQTGEQFYRGIGTVTGPGGYVRGENLPKASEALKKAGIPGIRYLDQGSRAIGEGTYNYVITDDTLISVARKYGIPLAVLSSPTGKKMLESLARRDQLAESPAQGQNRRTP